MNHASIIYALDDTTNQCLKLNSGINEYLQEVSESLVSHFMLEDFVIYFKPSTKNNLKQFMKVNHNKGCFFPKHAYSIKFGQGIVGESARQKKSILVNDTSKNPIYISEDAHRYSELVVPIINNNSIIGALDSEHSKKNFYTKELLHVFGITAKLICYFLNESKSKHQQKVEKKHFIFFTDLLNKKKVFLNEELSSKEVAEMINISPAYFSSIVNKISGQSFSSIVNSYRVRHIIELLKKDEYKKKTLLSIAMSSGFNSKSSFNLNFKKITLKSPSEFIADMS